MSTPTPDQSAAHEFLCELRTRISTQPLPYQHGVESRALESMWEVFGQARAAMKKYPGCKVFADAVTEMLNVQLRPFTAKWHRAHAEGRLNSRDGADEFRGELAEVQKKLRGFAETLHHMAYGVTDRDEPVPPVWTQAELDKCFADLPFGIPLGTRNLSDQVITGINTAEEGEISGRRKNFNINTAAGMNAVGAGFSGGGIRSATFCLGVTQVLADRGLLKDVDFLSTVSGGGYTGSFLTTRLGTTASEADVAGPHGPDPAPIRYVRHHAKFLNPVNLKDGWAMVTSTLAGMILNWSAPLLVIVLAALFANVLLPKNSDSFWSATLKITGGLTGFALVAYCGLLRTKKTWAKWGGWFLTISTALTLVTCVGWLADKGYEGFNRWVAGGWNYPLGVGLVGALIGAGPAIIRFFPVLQRARFRQIAMQVLLWITGLIIPILALLLFYTCRHFGEYFHSDSAASVWSLERYGGKAFLAGGAIILALVAVRLLNINLTAPHRLYRDRLAKTFIHSTDCEDAPVSLADVNKEHKAPYHLLNTTLNLPSSEEPALRDRKCAFFLFSKHWIGSATTGYHRTVEWKTNGEKVDLATAMAVSGAAASSYMGLGSKPTLTALLTALNVRLGFWIRQPNKKAMSESPGFLCLLREMTGVGMAEKAAWLNLSDGGHIENMAVYELLRRRCKFIVCVDGEADPGFTFGGLMTLVRHAQIDYGIRIEPRVNELRPDPKTGWSQAHALFCRIHYPAVNGQPSGTGLLLYMKLSVTGNEPELINRYRDLHPEFPHESTADQFFTEQQFEAYRQLGVHVAEGLFSPALMNNNTRPATIADWFKQLAGNLLEPQQI